MAKLTAAKRKRIPASDFGLPNQRKYPMPDKSHARNALARTSQAVHAGRMSTATEEKIAAKARGILGESTSQGGPKMKKASHKKKAHKGHAHHKAQAENHKRLMVHHATRMAAHMSEMGKSDGRSADMGTIAVPTKGNENYGAKGPTGTAGKTVASKKKKKVSGKASIKKAPTRAYGPDGIEWGTATREGV